VLQKSDLRAQLIKYYMHINTIIRRTTLLQQKVAQKLRVKLTSELLFLHLSEEIGELARELFNKASKMRSFRNELLRQELAQAVLDLFALATILSVDLEKELLAKLADMSRRATLKRSAMTAANRNN
jgi:NTP pyrophosphatase (non-canonical NTP hydrolase)